MSPAPDALDLTGRRILLTGASSGIGRATALLLSRHGADLTLVGRRPDALEATRAEADGPERHTVAPFDLTDVDAIPAWMKALAADAPFAGVVHAAGVGGATPLRTMGRKAMDAVTVPNLYAALALLRGVASKGVARDGCSVVVVSSIAALTAAPGLVAYSASKGAVQAAVRSAASELRGRRMRVNAVAPAYVATPMMEQSRDALPGFEAAVARQFLGLVEPHEVAVAVAYLLADASARVTGTTLVLDGGFSL